MKTHWLFPNRYRLIGWILFVPSAILGLAGMYEEFRLDFLTILLDAPKADTGFLYRLFWWMTDGGSFLTSHHNTLNLTDELAAIGIIIGLLFVAFSKEKVEDEMISRLRLEALQWAVYVNYIVLGALIILVHGGLFLNVMIYNMFTVLLMFIIRFRLAIRRNERTVLMAL
ncbi:hypothetical protein GCM10028803_09180 [Larkinella knui]|uniref:Uncharacterized protein n=1 Tax=Larkinella knui TaxID=2025310 RepID=A0A3P1CJ64_9BACT|nr:hypothetical protein [Larkinella knui]RRB13373.1 hypothetical protein EHT87_13930 [Larkinella knui]